MLALHIPRRDSDVENMALGINQVGISIHSESLLRVEKSSQLQEEEQHPANMGEPREHHSRTASAQLVHQVNNLRPRHKTASSCVSQIK